MRILITRDTVADGKPVFVGEVVEVKPETGLVLIQMGKARKAPEVTRAETADKPPDETAVDTVQQASPSGVQPTRSPSGVQTTRPPSGVQTTRPRKGKE